MADFQTESVPVARNIPIPHSISYRATTISRCTPFSLCYNSRSMLNYLYPLLWISSHHILVTRYDTSLSTIIISMISWPANCDLLSVTMIQCIQPNPLRARQRIVPTHTKNWTWYICRRNFKGYSTVSARSNQQVPLKSILSIHLCSHDLLMALNQTRNNFF